MRPVVTIETPAMGALEAVGIFGGIVGEFCIYKLMVKVNATMVDFD